MCRLEMLKCKKDVFKSKYQTCQLCGCRLTDCEKTVEHLIPRNIIKWVDFGNGDIHDERNLTILCKRCNEAKGSDIKSMDYYRRLCKDRFSDFVAFFRENQVAIEEYMWLYDKVAERYMNKCYGCLREQKAGSYNYTIRRKHDHAGHDLNNAILICKSCDKSWRYKRDREAREISSRARRMARILAPCMSVTRDYKEK